MKKFYALLVCFAIALTLLLIYLLQAKEFKETDFNINHSEIKWQKSKH